MSLKIKATRCRASDLKPGDLFSSVGQTYWSHQFSTTGSIGERVYIRTETPADQAPDAAVYVYRIEIER